MIKNPNTPAFWDNLIQTSQRKLIESPIYIEKCNIVLKILKHYSGKLLDIGVGYGHIESLIKKKKLNYVLHGIDIAESSIKNIRKLYGNNFKIGKITKIPFTDNYFNCVLLLDVLEHIPKIKSKKSLNEINRVLINNGIFIISVPLNDTKRDKLLNGHLRKYSPQSITIEIERAGFRIINKYILYAYSKLFKIKNILLKFFPKINKKPNLIIIVAQKI